MAKEFTEKYMQMKWELTKNIGYKMEKMNPRRLHTRRFNLEQ